MQRYCSKLLLTWLIWTLSNRKSTKRLYRAGFTQTAAIKYTAKRRAHVVINSAHGRRSLYRLCPKYHNNITCAAVRKSKLYYYYCNTQIAFGPNYTRH